MSDIHIIGVTQSRDLVGAALNVVQGAKVIIGSERQHAIIQPHININEKTEHQATLKLLPKLSELKSLIDGFSADFLNDQQASIVVLASGDPLYYGIGRWFSKHFDSQRLHFYPAISSVQMACHRLAISLQDVTVLSLHGRPLKMLRTKLKRSEKLLVLTDKHSNPQSLARECQDTHFAESTITVLENLSYPHERIRTFSVSELLTDSSQLSFDPLHVSLIEVKCTHRLDDASGIDSCIDRCVDSCIDTGANDDSNANVKVQHEERILPEFPGIPDKAYITGAEAGKGMITKREVRLCILSLLQPANEDVIWDIGAGCGGVAIELAYWNDKTTVYAIECHSERLEYLSANQQRFGVVHNLHIIKGHAPDCLVDLPMPNKVFIGGSGGNMAELLNTAWSLLPKEGLLVASAVVENTKQILNNFAHTVAATNAQIMNEIETVEVSVKRGQFTNTGLDYTSKLPVEVYKFKKA